MHQFQSFTRIERDDYGDRNVHDRGGTTSNDLSENRYGTGLKKVDHDLTAVKKTKRLFDGVIRATQLSRDLLSGCKSKTACCAALGVARCVPAETVRDRRNGGSPARKKEPVFLLRPTKTIAKNGESGTAANSLMSCHQSSTGPRPLPRARQGIAGCGIPVSVCWREVQTVPEWPPDEFGQRRRTTAWCRVAGRLP